ncbi:MAG TPA: hypothetical protein VHZ99_04495 [Steroidobacteraceae bacterium]|jgi:hypothetical protein|nr:hypothetical protein [Steroidobacteraceae bacterium]
MKIYGSDDRELMDVTSITREGCELIIQGRIFGSMPLKAKVRPEDVRAALRLLDLRTFWFLLTLPLRRRRG